MTSDDTQTYPQHGQTILKKIIFDFFDYMLSYLIISYRITSYHFASFPSYHITSYHNKVCEPLACLLLLLFLLLFYSFLPLTLNHLTYPPRFLYVTLQFKLPSFVSLCWAMSYARLTAFCFQVSSDLFSAQPATLVLH